jgi:hypothetical protein
MCWLVSHVSSGTFEIWKEDSFRSTSGFHFYNVVSEFQVCFRFPFLFTMWPALRWISFRSTLTQHWSAPRLGCLLLFERKNRWVSSSIWNPDQQNSEKMKNWLWPENSKNQSKKVPALTGSFAGSWRKVETPMVLRNFSKTWNWLLLYSEILQQYQNWFWKISRTWNQRL